MIRRDWVWGMGMGYHKGTFMQATERILAVEDDPGLRNGLVIFLKDLGYEPLEAGDGLKALNCFRAEQPDLVLLDLRIPEMDGLDVLSVITEESPETPVIVVSGADMMGDSIQALKRGAWDYVPKPITDLDILETAIRRSLERARLIRDNRKHVEHLEVLNRELTQAVDQLREDEEAARVLQSRMLPPGELSIGPYLFRQSVFSSSYLSGDFVDFFSIGDGEAGFYIADVSGHGAASAFVTVMLKTLFDQYRERLAQEDEEALRDPSDMLSRLNQDLCQLEIEKYLTIFYGVVDFRSNRLRYCSGGQFPPPLLRDSAGLTMINGHDEPVGLFEDTLFTTHELELPDRFLLMLVSDGILELFPRDTARSRVKLLMGEVSGPEAGMDSLIQKFAIEERNELPDDVSILTLSKEW